MENEYIVWVDLETTGLNVRTDKILEIAVIITDFDLKEICTYHCLVSNAKPTVERVIQMHADSGLTAELDAVDKFPTLKQIDSELVSILPKSDEKLQFYFAGNSVHFDARFIEKNFPQFYSMMSHRILDITSLKLYFRSKLGEKKYRKMLPPFVGTKHRAMDDIEDSIAFYRSAIKRRLLSGIFSSR